MSSDQSLTTTRVSNAMLLFLGHTQPPFANCSPTVTVTGTALLAAGATLSVGGSIFYVLRKGGAIFIERQDQISRRVGLISTAAKGAAYISIYTCFHTFFARIQPYFHPDRPTSYLAWYRPADDPTKRFAANGDFAPDESSLGEPDAHT